MQDEIKFVGLTDSFNVSVCLFHHMFGKCSSSSGRTLIISVQGVINTAFTHTMPLTCGNRWNTVAVHVPIGGSRAIKQVSFR